MGVGWRRTNEALKQKWNVASNDKGFVVTSNSRNEMMMRDAEKFAYQLRKIEAHVKRIQKDAHEMISDTRNIMLCSLPRTFDFTPSGQAVPEDPDPKLIGQSVQLDRFASADALLKQRLDEEVSEPLEAWLEAFLDVQSRMRKLEALRLELDSRRRTVDNLYAVVERQKQGLETGSAKLREKHEATIRTMQHKENKKNAVLAAFQEHECNTYQALYTLLKDTTCLKDYTAVAYSILQDVFGTACTAFDTRGLQSSNGRGFFRTLSGAFRSRKTDSTNTEDTQYCGKGHGVFDNMSIGAREETHAYVVPAAGAAGRYGVYSPGGYA